MKITSLTISNFRCFGPEPLTISLSEATCLVGTNGSGKSAVLVAIWAWFWRGRAEPRRLVQASVASIVAYVAFGKVLSPQYLVWLVPFIVLLQPLEWLLTASALVLAQVWFFHYRDVFALGGYVWLVFARDVLVLALFALVLVRLRRSAAEDEDSVLLEHELPLRVPS